MSTPMTSGGQPITRARMKRLLDAMPVRVAYATHHRPCPWFVEHAHDRVRHLHPHSDLTDEQFEDARADDIRAAAQVLTDAGYRVELRWVPDEAMLAEIPTPARDYLAQTTPRLQAVFVID